ncbi:formyltransferase family protein [Paenibacillus filicis]|uniref:Formyltransferase family protein n=1 Tax=Paenibacillus gyeongsangnamensis TaxID=3388067 RepID=A0ABT4QC24_9BACL|nr:formyltransferase family protein [Paenibacillus filicis]MCZ8514434.1 formyltransferase family protein [Paenibacillus filicis]
MPLTLFVMNQKGLTVLKVLQFHFGNSFICQVIGSRDPAVQNDYYDEIHSYCRECELPFIDRLEFGNRQPISDTAIAVGWRWLIRGYPSLIVFHDSLLPRYRGFAPLVSCLINKEPQIGVTVLLASEEYDKGPLLAQEAIDVQYPVKIAEMINKISGLYGELALRIGRMIISGEALQGVPQDESAASYSLWRDEEDYWIDWNQSAGTIRRFVDSVGYPYQGAAATIGGKKVAVLDCEVVSDVRIENRTPGKIIFLHEGIPTVVCGEGLLKLREVVDYETRESRLLIRRLRNRFK